MPKPLKVIQTGANLMSNRFQPYEEIQTEAVLRYARLAQFKGALYILYLTATPRNKQANQQTNKQRNKHKQNYKQTMELEVPRETLSIQLGSNTLLICMKASTFT